MKKFIGKCLVGNVVSVHSGDNEDLSKNTLRSLTAEIGGFAGDKHHGPTRKAFNVDWQPAGTVRRNERQWSAVSVEELAHITERLALTEPLTATAWLRPAAGRRGLVGIVDVPGAITAGDKVEVQVYEEPAIRLL